MRLSDEEEKRLAEALVTYQEELLNRGERTFDLVLSIAYQQQPVYLNRKEEAFMISKSTMDEDMRRLRADLIKYGIEIVSFGRQGLVYKGAERSIRTMIYDLINKNLGRIDFSARNARKSLRFKEFSNSIFHLRRLQSYRSHLYRYYDQTRR